MGEGQKEKIDKRGGPARKKGEKGFNAYRIWGFKLIFNFKKRNSIE